MKTLAEQIDAHLHKGREEKKHKKDSFYPTESETSMFELWHKWKGTPVSNPIDVKDQFGLRTRTLVEDVVVGFFREMDILIEPRPYTDREGKYLEHPDQHRVEMERNGIKITGYMDALIKEDSVEVPVEVKTSFGDWQKKNKLDVGRPNTNYLKQLAMYMDYNKADKGYLFHVHFASKGFIVEEIYQFVLIRKGNEFHCGSTIFTLDEVYARYKECYDKYILQDVEPDPFEFYYKYPIEKINWKNLPGYRIGAARNNRAVIGDWNVIYSSYKDLWIEKQGTVLGYTDAELARIKELTKGYSNWDKPKFDAVVYEK